MTKKKKLYESIDSNIQTEEIYGEILCQRYLIDTDYLENRDFELKQRQLNTSKNRVFCKIKFLRHNFNIFIASLDNRKVRKTHKRTASSSITNEY